MAPNAPEDEEEDLVLRRIFAERARMNDTLDKPSHLNFFPKEDPSNKSTMLPIVEPVPMEANSTKDNAANTVDFFGQNIPTTMEANAQANNVTNAVVFFSDNVPTIMAHPVNRPGSTGGTTSKQFELISGLMVQLSQDAEISLTEDGFLSVRVQTASLGDSFLSARGVRIQARIVGSDVRDLVVLLEGMTLDPLATRERVQDFLNSFGLPKVQEESSAAHRSSRLNREEWEQFLQNAQTNTPQDGALLIPLGNIQKADELGLFHKLDLKIPNAQVKAAQCQLPSHNATMDFTDCKGSEGATVRTLLEYYARSILDKMDLVSGHKADVSISAVASDVASCKASVIGASVGSLLGPAGFVAGSYLGNRWMRRVSSSVSGGAAGLILFGPVGLVAGAVATEGRAPAQPRPNNITRVDEKGHAQRRGLVEATADNVAANKYEMAGSTGVFAGAAMGMAIAGPIGLVAGSVAGSLSGRKLVQAASSSTGSNGIDEKNAGEDKPYRFGDLTRGVVARGKEKRDAKEGGYRFGDFTRGLFS